MVVHLTSQESTCIKIVIIDKKGLYVLLAVRENLTTFILYALVQVYFWLHICIKNRITKLPGYKLIQGFFRSAKRTALKNVIVTQNRLTKT